MMKKWMQALKLAANGNSAKESARELGVSERAINENLKRAKKKLNARTVAEAVYKAVKAGVICLLIAQQLYGIPNDFTRIRGEGRLTIRTTRRDDDI